MKIIFAVLFTFMVSATVNASQLPKQNLLSREMVTKLHNTIRQNGCNINICFAIDGSGSITPQEFRTVQDFILDVTAIIQSFESEPKFAATQFGDDAEIISRLTDDVVAFNQELFVATPNNGASTAIGAGIFFCDRQLARTFGNANKIVVFTDGRNNAGMDPVVRADNFRRRDPNGEVCTVAIGSSDMTNLLAITGGDPDKVLGVSDFIELSFIVESLVIGLCG